MNAWTIAKGILLAMALTSLFSLLFWGGCTAIALKGINDTVKALPKPTPPTIPKAHIPQPTPRRIIRPDPPTYKTPKTHSPNQDTTHQLKIIANGQTCYYNNKTLEKHCVPNK